MNEGLSCTEYGFGEFKLAQFFNGFIHLKKNLFSKKYRFYGTGESIISFFKTHLPNYTISQNKDGMLFLCEDCAVEIQNTSTRHSCLSSLFGSENEVNQVIDLLKANFEEVGSTIEWVYNAKGNSIRIPVNNENQPITEFYPALKGKSIEEYYEQYMNSRASIMILIGPPGTGKTTFLRGLISYTKSNAILSYDPNVLERDDFFADFIRDDDCSILVLEDADNYLKPRKDGNLLMMKFLNIGDGLVSSYGKKIIFTTNLPSSNEIDSALIRPGRCFDILNFDKLTADQANSIINKMNIEQEPFKTSVTLAEIFNTNEFSNEHRQNSIGFVK